MSTHRKRALLLLMATIALDIALGVVFGAVQGIGTWHGIYCATADATTVGCDVTPRGWLAYAVSFAELLTLVPLVGSVFAFFTTGLTATHVDRRHDELKERLPLMVTYDSRDTWEREDLSAYAEDPAPAAPPFNPNMALIDHMKRNQGRPPEDT